MYLNGDGAVRSTIYPYKPHSAPYSRTYGHSKIKGRNSVDIYFIP